MSAQQPQPSNRLRRLRRLIAAQAGIAGTGVMIAFLVGGRPAATAAALGGLACLVPQTWFAWRVFGADPEDPGAMVRALYRGEGAKLAATALAFVVIYRAWPGVPLAPLVLTFIAVQTVHWFAPLLLEQ